MRIVRVRISNFRCIQWAELFPVKHNVLLGPNNTGKTAVLEALNLLLNPEGPATVDENDFYSRFYFVPETGGEGARTADSVTADGQAVEPPTITVEVVLAGLTREDEDLFKANLVPWNEADKQVVEATAEGEDPFAAAASAIRVVFQAWYDSDEDAFRSRTYFLRAPGQDRDMCDEFTRRHKRQVAFLIYRDFRGLTRPITLEPTTLFSRLLQSQGIVPRHFEQVLERMQGALDPMVGEPDFIALLNSYKAEIERFLPLSTGDTSAMTFEVTDRTRSRVKDVAHLYVRDELPLPLQKMGAGTRSLAILAMLTLIMRRRQRGILALEEPETFLFPHAQRRIIDECLALADQTFVTTHSPYVLERMPLEGVTRIARQSGGAISWHPISPTSVQQVNLYFRKLRQGFSEALLGRGVVIVEGDSDRWWLNGASRIMNRQTHNGKLQEALELQGIAVVSADANGDIPKLGRFFVAAGLQVVGVADRTDDAGLVADFCTAPFPVILLQHAGLEDLAGRTLPLDLVRRILAEAPDCRTPLFDIAQLAALDEAELRERCRESLIKNKGSAGMHEWILGQLGPATLPAPLKEIIDRVSSFVAGAEPFGTHSLPS